MTGDPQRLLSSLSDLEPLERELLASVRDVAPPAQAKSEAWTAIASKLAPAIALVVAQGGAASAAAAAGSAGGVAAASGAAAAQAGVGASSAVGSGVTASGISALLTKAVVLKLAIGLGVSAAAVGGGAYWLREDAPPASRPSPAIAPAPAAAATPAAPEAPAAAPDPCADGSPCATGVPSPDSDAPKPTIRSRRDRLAAESRLLSEAHSQLRQGDAAAAQASLQRLQTRFRHGELIQEREVLRIEVLQAQGADAEAKRRARLFVQRYGQSPHSVKLRRLLEGQ